MRKMKKEILFVMVVAIAMISGTFGQNKQGEFTPLTKLTWEVSSVKENYLPLEPLQIRFKLTNNTVLPTRLGDRFSLDLYIKHGEKTTKFEQLAYFSNDNIFVAPLKPEQSIELFRLQDFNSAKMFPEPGRYDLTFSVPYENDDDKLEELRTNSFSVNINEPQGTDKEAYDFLKKYDNRSLFFGISERKDSESLQKEFVERFGESAYGQYAIENLASLYVLQGNLEKAQSEFQKLKSSDNPIISKRAAQSITDIELKKASSEKDRQQPE